MQRTLLLGTDHTELGQPAFASLGPISAGLTRGRHPKAYHYVDPNEDALVVASGDDFHLMAVADGHNGILASHTAIQAIHDAVPTLAHLDAREAAAEAALAARDAVALLRPPPSDRSQSATTLTVAVVRGEKGAATGWADSVAAHLRGKQVRVLTSPARDFRAAGAAPAPLPDPSSFPLRAGDRVLVATDGLVDFLPRPWTRSLAQLLATRDDPEVAAEAAVWAAGEGGSGDNLAICLLQHQT